MKSGETRRAGNLGRASPVLIACVLAALVMAPRMAQPEFGLLDDGTTLSAARALSQGEGLRWELGSARSRPAYWLSWAALYAVAGRNPEGYFYGNLALLIGLAVSAVWLVSAWGAGRVGALLVSIALVLSAPVVENYYTLSKGEPLQVLLLTLSLVGMGRISHIGSAVARTWLGAGIVLALLMAQLTKESGVLVVPIALTWVVVSQWKRLGDRTRVGHAAKRFLAMGVIALLIFLVVRLRSLAGTEGTGYASGFALTAERLISSWVRWGVWILYSFPHLVPLFALAGLVAGRGRLRNVGVLAGASLIWMAWWWIAYLPWVFVASYYLLPFTLGLAVFGASVLEASAKLAVQADRTGWACRGLMAATGVLFALAQFNNVSMARQQLAVDSANARGLVSLARLAPQGADLALGIAEPSEYVDQARLLFTELYARGDIQVRYSLPALEAGEHGSLPRMAALITLENQVLLSPRLGVDEPDQRELAARLEGVLGLHYDEVFRAEARFQGMRFDFPKALCALFAVAGEGGAAGGPLPSSSIRRYCSRPGWIDGRPFLYRWVVYSLSEDPAIAGSGSSAVSRRRDGIARR